MLPIRSTLTALSFALATSAFAPLALAQLAPVAADPLPIAPFREPALAAAFSDSQPNLRLPDVPRPQQQRPLTAAVPTATPQEADFPLVNGQPYQPPTEGDLVRYYFHNTFGVAGQAGTAIRALFGQAVDSPSGWDQDWAGFGERLGSNEGISIINGTVKLGLSDLFHEDFRYFRCRGCTPRRKIFNVLLAEVTARHGEDGHRMISITPIASHIAGTVVAHAAWYPAGNDGFGRSAGSVATALVTQVGIHLFEEFFLRSAQEKLPHPIAKRLPGAKPPKPITD